MRLVIVLAMLLAFCTRQAVALRERCDRRAASGCEAQFRRCKLFSATPGDREALCRCGAEYYGECLTKVGCTVDMLSECTNFISENDCPNPLICGVNCASNGLIPDNASVVPVNNYGTKPIRLRFCSVHVDEQYLADYNIVKMKQCSRLEDYIVCDRWLPRSTFMPVAIPPSATQILVDRCETTADGEEEQCGSLPVYLVYSNPLNPPTDITIPPANPSEAYCASDSDCTGSKCDTTQQPSTCAPKVHANFATTGAHFFDVHHM